MNILASVAAPGGIMSALDKRAAQMGWSRAQLLTRAGLTQTDWDALNTALGGANGANFRRLLNASRSAVLFVEQSLPVMEGPGGVVNANSHNTQIVSHFGDLS